jgi:hypothetical protein
VDGDLMLAPGFPAPPNTDYIGYHTYIGMFLSMFIACITNYTVHITTVLHITQYYIMKFSFPVVIFLCVLHSWMAVKPKTGFFSGIALQQFTIKSTKFLCNVGQELKRVMQLSYD